MKILFSLGHPAHYHLFKNVISSLKARRHDVFVVMKSKDVLENLLKKDGIEYVNFQPESRKNNKLSIAWSLAKRTWKLYRFVQKAKPDIMVGTSAEITYVGRLLNIPSVVVNEDDCDIVPFFSMLAYPFASSILVPKNCRVGRWAGKSVFYEGYHELAYLHPKRFVPNPEVLEQLSPDGKPYYILRFTSLAAHHDVGKKGITLEIAQKIIQFLASSGKVYITSERKLEPELEPYRISIHPSEIHSALYFADMFIGDSQTMAIEAAVLGTPAVRFNDFVGVISCINELEQDYQLAYGVRTTEPELLYDLIRQLLATDDLKGLWKRRSEILLQKKIDVASFMAWYIENYPVSMQVMKKDSSYQFMFR